MPITILMPALSPTMKSGTLTKWLIDVGTNVKPGDVIAEIETDKVTMEFESVDKGIVAAILKDSGSQGVPINAPIAVLREKGDTDESINAYIARLNGGDADNGALNGDNLSDNTGQSREKSENADDDGAKKSETSKEHIANNSSNDSCGTSSHEIHFAGGSRRIFATPLARVFAKTHSIDIAKIVGSGPNGRIIKNDVINAASNNKVASNMNCSGRGNLENLDNCIQVKSTAVPISNMRSVIAQRLTESKQNIPHFYLSASVKVGKLLRLRAEINSGLEKMSNILESNANSAGKSEKFSEKISVNDMFVRAVGLALHYVPDMNISWNGDEILRYSSSDVSIAVALKDGLITPIVRNIENKSLRAISLEIKDLASRANAGKLLAHEFQGGNFTISNLGMYGIESFSAIINPPQSAILAIGAAIKTPIAIDNQVVIEDIVHLTLSCDHRSIDGAVAAKFLQALTTLIELPTTLT